MSTAKYSQIKQFIIDKIRAGELTAGMKVPSENKLSDMFSVHHSTAQKALRELVFEGYIESRRGSGSYVKEPTLKRSGNLAVIVNDVKGEYYSSLIAAVQDEAIKHSYNVLYFSSHESSEKEQTIINDLANASQLDGLLVVPAHNGDWQLQLQFYAGLQEQQIPVILLLTPKEQNSFHHICNDDHQGTYNAVKYLYEKGHREFGFVGHSIPNNIIQDQRLKGFHDALEDLELPFNEDHLIRIPYPSFENGLRAAEMIADLPHKPTAFLAVADILTIAMLVRFREFGILVPGDIALIGNGNINLSAERNFSLTTLDDRPEELATQAVQLLINDIHNGISTPQAIEITQELIIRKST